jgi:Trk K+ transport system NAD-binding subunit
MACSGLELKTLVAGLPEDFIIASIMRGTRILIPHGDTVIQPGDNLTIITGREQTQAVLHMFSEEGA